MSLVSRGSAVPEVLQQLWTAKASFTDSLSSSRVLVVGICRKHMDGQAQHAHGGLEQRTRYTRVEECGLAQIQRKDGGRGWGGGNWRVARS